MENKKNFIANCQYQLQKELAAYGVPVTVDNGGSYHYTEKAPNVPVVRVYSDYVPVKGNAQLIRTLQHNGYNVERTRRENKMYFYVSEEVTPDPAIDVPGFPAAHTVHVEFPAGSEIFSNDEPIAAEAPAAEAPAVTIHTDAEYRENELNRNNSLYGTTFCGKEASPYAKRYGYLDYHTFASAFDAILNNAIMQETTEKGYEWEPVTGCGPFYYDEEGNEVDEDFYWENQDTCYENYPDVYQQFIVSDYGAKLIQQYEVGGLWYCEELDIYLWDISHWGTSWDYVLTNIHLNAGEAAFREGASND